MESFPQFAQLPPEIRRMIWTAALPVGDRPGCFVYAGWHFDENEPLDHESSEDEQPLDNNSIHIQVPTAELFFVSREARLVAKTWAITHGIKLASGKETRGPVCVRRWDPQNDTMYVPRDHWEEFCDSATGVSAASYTAISHLALPAFTAYYSITTLLSLMNYMPHLKKVYVVWGDVPPPVFGAAVARYDESDGNDAEARVDVYPPWDLVPETDSNVTMCVVDPVDGTRRMEEGDLDEWMEEIDEMIQEMIQEDDEFPFPDHCVDTETGKFMVDFVSVRMVRQ